LTPAYADGVSTPRQLAVSGAALPVRIFSIQNYSYKLKILLNFSRIHVQFL